MTDNKYVRPSEEEHRAIATYLEDDFFRYLDFLDSNKYENDKEKEFIKRFIRVVTGSFGKSQKDIAEALKKGDHAVISNATKRVNQILTVFCEGKTTYPIRIFFYHINSKGQKKRPQCHLVCSKQKTITTVNDSERIYSYNILPFEKAKIAVTEDVKDSPPEIVVPAHVCSPEDAQPKQLDKLVLLLDNHQLSEANRLLHQLDPLNHKVIFYKQIVALKSKPIRKFSNQEMNVLCKSLEVLLNTSLKDLAAVLLNSIFKKYHKRFGRRFLFTLPEETVIDPTEYPVEYGFIQSIMNN